MSKLTLNKQTLVDIADAVREKTGSEDLIAIEDLDDAVKNISGGGNGGGGIVEVDDLPNPALAIPVPNTGYVEKVYFDTSLSVDEVVAELQKLSYEEGFYYILYDGENSDIEIEDYGDGRYYIGVYINNEYASIFTNDTRSQNFGWNPDFNGEIEFNRNVISGVDGWSCGAENDKITNLCYIDKQPNPEFNSESVYKLPDETLWMYEDGWEKLAKQKKVTIINDAGYELTFGIYPDCENLAAEDDNDFNTNIQPVTLPENGKLELYVTASVAIYNTYHIGVHRNRLVNARAISVDEFDNSHDEATIVILTDNNAVIHLVGIEM
jgi:hypothetical protein